MNFLAVAIIGGNLARHFLAEADVKVAVILFNFDMAASRMLDSVNETQGPIMGIAVDIH